MVGKNLAADPLLLSLKSLCTPTSARTNVRISQKKVEQTTSVS